MYLPWVISLRNPVPLVKDRPRIKEQIESNSGTIGRFLVALLNTSA
jgi:hypothetical protein